MQGKRGDRMKKVIAVVGPTASGKTALAVAIAKAVQGEVVCADSMQVYQGMPIATATATAEEQVGVPHHLLAFLHPSESFSVADYVALAQKTISEIIERGHCPVLCGGTGLFVDALLQNVQFLPEKQNPALRTSLLRRAEQEGQAALYGELAAIDPVAAQKIHPNDLKRIVRALEVFEGTGILFSQWEVRSRTVPTEIQPLFLGIDYHNRAQLYDRINRRVDGMIETGLVEEAKQFFAGDHHATSRQAIGHKELAPYLAGELSLAQATENLKKETRHYAKRQLTWFRRNQSIHWFDPEETPDYTQQAIALACTFLKGAE